MAGVVRPLRTQQHSLLHHLLSLSLSNKPTSLIQQQHHYYKKQQLSFFSQTNLNAHRSNSVRLKGTLLPANLQENNSDSESSDEGRNRNKKKREARRAVQWGIDLANFSNPQIKRIFRVAAVEIEVFEAIMLVKRLGPDVREGKRRQFSYIVWL
ncbi:hypothetical protein GIB67_028700 [Kingdonia uniflora]|uniref:Uncharacterized protein n=1 Tax=Kingdonia uniflora TaxID=39325 RepID=A0A7J7NA20_9MAGN|nr:hypothetical protein GIB67_028700 [Kingdonia uniflora]